MPTDLTWFDANVPERAVMMMYETSMMLHERRKSVRLPALSMSSAAHTAKMRFQTLRKPLRRVCCVTEVIPTVVRIRLR
jgi:hypothetical protein